MQFMNWTVVDTGAYDYAADTRGYTWGGVADFADRWWTLRFGEALLSKRPNGMTCKRICRMPIRRTMNWSSNPAC